MTLVDGLPQVSIDRLHSYVRLLDRWRKVTNLVSERSFAEVWSRHIEDSIQLQLARPTALRWLDIGSGAGFPAVVIATLLAGRQGAEVHCVESDGRKCAFLRAVVEDLRIPVKVYNARAETVSIAQTGSVDAITARAFSSVDMILALTQDYLENGAVAVLPRGKTWPREVETLDPRRYAVNSTSSLGGGAILTIQDRGGNPL
jgi:16S rRNA (guanine527-N7)-methyltransferase